MIKSTSSKIDQKKIPASYSQTNKYKPIQLLNTKDTKPNLLFYSNKLYVKNWVDTKKGIPNKSENTNTTGMSYESRLEQALLNQKYTTLTVKVLQ